MRTNLLEKTRWCLASDFPLHAFTSKDIGYCIVDATSHRVKIALHKLILNQIFVKPGLNGLKAAKLKLAIVLERKNNSTLIIMILIKIIMIIIIIRRTTTLGMGISFLSIEIPYSSVRTISKRINGVILL